MPDRPPEHDPSRPPPRPESGDWARATDHLWKTLQTINEWTRFADAKAAAVLTANGVLGTLAAGLIEKQWTLLNQFRMSYLVASICVIALIVSAIACVVLLISSRFCVKCLLPRVEIPGEFTSILFFHHVAEYEDFHRYLDEARTLGEEDHAFQEVGAQVWANAKVAREKHTEITLAICRTEMSLGAILIAAILFAIAAGVAAYLKP